MAEEKKEGEELTPETPAAEDKQKAQEETDIDYKAELEIAQKQTEADKKQLGQAEHTIEGLKKELKESGKFDAEQIKEIVQSAVSEAISPIQVELREEKIRQKISSVCSNPDEAELTLFHLKNSIKSSGNLTTDIENARSIANKNRLTSKVSELERTLKSKEAKGEGSGEGGAKPPVEEKIPQMTSEEKRLVGEDLQSGRIKAKDGQLVSSAKEKYFKKIGKPVPQD